MPYKVKKQDGKFCVYKTTDGSIVKCHATKKKADAHRDALNINVHGTLDVDGLVDGLIEETMVNALASAVIDQAYAADGEDAALVTIPNVPLVEAGVEYELSTGTVDFTPEDLADMVAAANEDPSIPSPRFKLGHIDPRFNGKQYDATPAFGKFVNLRLSDNGMVIYADHVGAPAWLASVMASAYPSRSIEAFPNVESRASDKVWRWVITCVGALGIYWPGIRQLEDLPMYYGEDVPEDVEVVTASGGDDIKLKGRGNKSEASANLDDVRRAWYGDHIQENAEMRWWWIRAVLVDPNELIVEDDESGQLYKVPFKSDAKGVVSFGDAQAVRIDYVDDATPEEKQAAAAYVAAGLVDGHQVAASWSSRAESRPANATQKEGGMDRATAIKMLGLPEDASEEQITAALSGVIQAFEPENPTETLAAANAAQNESPPEGGEQPVTPAATPAVPQTAEPEEPLARPALTPEQIAAAGHVGKGDKPTITLDRASFDTLMEQAKLGGKAWARLESVENEKLLDEAMAAGKFPPARREAWETYLKADPEGAKAALAELQPGLVPVYEIGGAGGNGDQEEAITYPVHLFPEIQKRKAREAAVAAGQAQMSRVQTDGTMRRG